MMFGISFSVDITQQIIHQIQSLLIKQEIFMFTKFYLQITTHNLLNSLITTTIDFLSQTVFLIPIMALIHLVATFTKTEVKLFNIKSAVSMRTLTITHTHIHIFQQQKINHPKIT